MFNEGNRDFAFQFCGGSPEDCSPPWRQHEGHGFWHGPRFFERGDVKYALLELLQERPMHGY